MDGLVQRLLRLGGRDRDPLLAGQFLGDLVPDQPGQGGLRPLRRVQVDGRRVLRGGLAEVGDRGIEGRDRDPLVAHDRRRPHLHRGARGHGQADTDHDGGRLDQPPKHRTIPSPR
jgi:hypothetical protein